MSINSQSKTDYYLNVAGCIPGIKEVSGLARSGRGCYRVAQGVFVDLKNMTRENPSSNKNLDDFAYVIENSDPFRSKLDQFREQHKKITLRMLKQEVPELLENSKYLTEKGRKDYNFGEILDGSLDFTRGIMESRTARFLIRTNPSVTYQMPSMKNIAHHMFNKVSLSRSIPGCVAWLAFNTYAPAEPFAPVVISGVYDLGFTTERKDGRDGNTYYATKAT
jgi:hypothetical protein